MVQKGAVIEFTEISELREFLSQLKGETCVSISVEFEEGSELEITKEFSEPEQYLASEGTDREND